MLNVIKQGLLEVQIELYLAFKHMIAKLNSIYVPLKDFKNAFNSAFLKGIPMIVMIIYMFICRINLPTFYYKKLKYYPYLGMFFNKILAL